MDMKYLALIVLMIILSGCSSSRFVSRDSVEIHRDDFSSQIEYLGVTKQINAESISDEGVNYFLRSFENTESGNIEHQIYVDIYYMSSSWRYYQRAAYEGGDDADFVQINRDVVTCTSGICAFNEVFGIQVPHGVLMENIDGLRLKAYAQSGNEFIIELSEEQITAQLNALEK